VQVIRVERRDREPALAAPVFALGREHPADPDLGEDLLDFAPAAIAVGTPRRIALIASGSVKATI
jgi:hypothetical protein